jgi:hypothetical protein
MYGTMVIKEILKYLCAGSLIMLASCANVPSKSARYAPAPRQEYLVAQQTPLPTPSQSQMIITVDADGAPSVTFNRGPNDERPEDETMRQNPDGSITVHRNSPFAIASGMTDEEMRRFMASPEYQARIRRLQQPA